MDKVKATELTSVCPISRTVFLEIAMDEVKPIIEEYLKEFSQIFVDLEEYISSHIRKQERIKLTNHFYVDEKLKTLVPDFEEYEVDIIKNVKEFKEKSYLKKHVVLLEKESSLPTPTWCIQNWKYLFNQRDDVKWIICECNDAQYREEYGHVCALNITEDEIRSLSELDERGEEAIAFPTISLCLGIEDMAFSGMTGFLGMTGSIKNFVGNESIKKFVGNVCCKNKIYPSDFYDKYKVQLDNYNVLSDYFGLEVVEMSTKATEITKALLEDGGEEILSKLQGDIFRIIKKYTTEKTCGGVKMQTKEELLNCEKIRADIEPYEERILTDPNRGHWDLWMDDDTDQYTIKMDNEYMARNPRADIQDEGVIAIDFGTKSTIVVYQSNIEHSLPMGIGDGNLSKAPSAKRYENPTMMEFVNIDRFLEAYNSKMGRPETKWEDLPISHTAMDKFAISKSEEYYAFLYQIKQWAGQREKQFRIQPINGESFILPSFLDLKDGDFNPIEIYAYYIGLYINNMRKGHGIFLDYYLSFPVTYESRIRKKIVESFEKGLKKSLPEVIQKDSKIMSQFRVNGEISEPAAYAVCALQEYGFEPEEDEEIFYGIFDFGGGTTDFDFGLWKKSAKKRYDYRIENFGAGGDEYLGGENLLEMLAFEIFKSNQNIMRENGFTFTLAPTSKEFVGSDALLSDSQEAEKNMHNLMEVLRPFWEKEEQNPQETENGKDYEEVESTVDDIVSLKVELFDKDGKNYPNVELESSLSFIDGFIESKIRGGVKNFFSSLLLSYQNDKVQKPTTVNILLAGNSCKSAVVKRIFDEEIAIEENKIKERFGLEQSVKFFEIFPPLGTKEAYIKMKERNIPYREDDYERPTGKTGVAFGLIQCREGGLIERVSNLDISAEIDFQFFLGWQSKKKFVLFKDENKITKLKGKPDYQQWYQFVEADEKTFYLYYTTLPECVGGELMVEGNAAVKRLKCTIDCVNEGAYVFIKATSPHTIQYAVSPDYDVERNHIGEIYTKELS